MKLPHVLQSPESTQTTTSGGKAPNDTAPDGAVDVSDRVTDKEVVDDSVDWATAGDPDDDLPQDEAPPNEDSTGDEDETPAPSKVVKQPAKKAPAKPAADDKSDDTQPGTDDEHADEDATQPPAKAEEPKPETPEQKAERERLQKEAEEKDFDELKKYYVLPEDYVERLRTEPELVMPELAAKVHQAVFRGMQKYMMQAIPQFLQQHTQLQEANTAAKEAFFSRWPSLKGHDARVLQVGQMYSQLNPKATPQQKLEQVGRMACVALGIDPDPAPDGEDRPQPRPKAKVPPKKKQVMKPANPSGSGNASPPASDNPFEEIAEEFLAEDRGE